MNDAERTFLSEQVAMMHRVVLACPNDKCSLQLKTFMSVALISRWFNGIRDSGCPLDLCDRCLTAIEQSEGFKLWKKY